MRWLVKEEPENYNFDQFMADGSTVWSGVRNPVAQKNLRAMQKGDHVFFYHTGKEKAIVGTAKVAVPAYPDPKEKTGNLVVVELVPDKKLKRPVTLAAGANRLAGNQPAGSRAAVRSVLDGQRPDP